jgi:hypothetical protein
MTLSITETQHDNALHYAECRYAEGCVLSIIMPSVTMLNDIRLSFVMLNVVMLGVVAPRPMLGNGYVSWNRFTILSSTWGKCFKLFYSPKLSI